MNLLDEVKAEIEAMRKTIARREAELKDAYLILRSLEKLLTKAES